MPAIPSHVDKQYGGSAPDISHFIPEPEHRGDNIRYNSNPESLFDLVRLKLLDDLNWLIASRVSDPDPLRSLFRIHLDFLSQIRIRIRIHFKKHGFGSG